MKSFNLTHRSWLPVLAGCLLLALPVSAEFYKYVDKNGVTRFVDDLSKIPPEYQDAHQSYQE